MQQRCKCNAISFSKQNNYIKLLILNFSVTFFCFLCTGYFEKIFLNKMDSTDNKQIFKEIKQGNQKAFELLYKRYYFRLKGYADKFIAHQEITEDIIQECFLILWEKREKITDISISSLLFKMVRNGCLNHLKHIAIASEYQIEQQTLASGEERLYYADFGLHAAHKLLYEELNEQVELIVNNLPERCREVFVLSRHEGLKNREIAEKLKISTTAVEKHISKALNTFACYFKRQYPIDITYLALFVCHFFV